VRSSTRGIVIAVVTFACTIPCLVTAATPSAATTRTTTTTTRAASSQPTTRPDPHLWARRNVDLLRESFTRVPADKDGDAVSLLEFSVSYNPLLARDPYAGQVLNIIEAALAQNVVDRDAREEIEEVAKALHRPPEQRAAPSPAQREVREAQAMEQRHALHRRDGDWAALALDYYGAAQDERRQKRVERANLYFDKLVELLRDHPPARDAKLADALRYPAYGIARLALEMGRQPDLDALIPSFPDPLRLDLLLGYACAHIQDGHIERGRAIVEQRVRRLSPSVADHMLAALDGQRVRPLASKHVTTTRSVAGPRPSPATSAAATAATAATRGGEPVLGESLPQLSHVIAVVAHAHARRGDVDAAARVKSGYWEDVKAHDVALLAKFAAEGGHRDAAVAAFGRAIELEKDDPTMTPAELDEKIPLLREAVTLGQLDLAYGMLSTSADPGAKVRYHLAKAHRARGDAARADALIDDAIAIAGKGRREGNVLALIAVDIHARGQVERAEGLLIQAMDHIEGVDFGFSGTAAIVRAAMEMNRLDLLDRCYASYDNPGEKTLLCIVATRAGLSGLNEHSN
jgi:tetratricopeptide (TPR) repeat protein